MHEVEKKNIKLKGLDNHHWYHSVFFIGIANIF